MCLCARCVFVLRMSVHCGEVCHCVISVCVYVIVLCVCVLSFELSGASLDFVACILRATTMADGASESGSHTRGSRARGLRSGALQSQSPTSNVNRTSKAKKEKDDKNNPAMEWLDANPQVDEDIVYVRALRACLLFKRFRAFRRARLKENELWLDSLRLHEKVFFYLEPFCVNDSE